MKMQIQLMSLCSWSRQSILNKKIKEKTYNSNNNTDDDDDDDNNNNNNNNNRNNNNNNVNKW